VGNLGEKRVNWVRGGVLRVELRECSRYLSPLQIPG
jgi:hypothetical protein